VWFATITVVGLIPTSSTMNLNYHYRLLSYIILFMACVNIFTKNLYETHNARFLAQDNWPEWYFHVWDIMERCSGLFVLNDLNIGDIKLFITDSLNVYSTGEQLAGLARYPNIIYIHKDFERRPDVIGHEMLHLMMFRYREGDSFFDTCDPMVNVRVWSNF